jgi:hypothetical protein
MWRMISAAADGGERAFDVADDFGEGDLIGRAAEAVAAGDSAFAFEDAGGFEVVEDLFEESFGNVLGGGNGLDADDGVAVVQAQNDERSKRIMPSLRKLHAANPTMWDGAVNPGVNR